MANIFPVNAEYDQKPNLSIGLFGKRIYGDQTLGEYLLEFLLVFASAKTDDGLGKYKFHTTEQVENGRLAYFTVPRNGLKRFVFYDRSKRDSRSEIDQIAYDEMMEMLAHKSEDGEWRYVLQDLLYGYALVIKKRGWYAQSLYPIAPELLFPETLGINNRKAKGADSSKIAIETDFEYGQHDFLARGGEMYYLQLLQGLCDQNNDSKYRKRIERGIEHMLTAHSAGFSTIANHLQEWWLNNQGIPESERGLTRKMNLGYLQEGFARRAEYSLMELACFLGNNLHPVMRIELMTKGIVLSLLRSMHLQAYYKVHPNAEREPAWIIDMRAGSATSNIAKLAAKSYRDAYAEFGNALNIICKEDSDAESDERFIEVTKELKNTAEVFKKIGKEIQLVIPPKGSYERFSLSEDLVRYLVLSIVNPKKKMTFDSFLNELFTHYGMVIGPDEYNLINGEPGMSGYFMENKLQFQAYLKNCGLLRDLSDATSIVENPYAEVDLS